MNKPDIAAAHNSLLVVVGESVTRDGRTQREIATALGVAPSYLGDILSGRRNFTPDVVDGLHRVLKETRPIDRWRVLGARARGWDVK